MEKAPVSANGRTSASNLDEGISRLDKTLNRIYLPEIMAAKRVIHSRMRRKRERQIQGGRGGGPTLYQFIMESRRRKMGSQLNGGSEHALDDVPEVEGVEKREHNPPTRQDSVFQSVDLSEIAGLREDPNRTPTPQPTFTDGPPEQRQVVRKSEAVAALSNVSEKNQLNSRSSSGHSSSRSDEVQEHYELQVRPGYQNAQQIEMATAACQSKERSPLERSSSLEESSTRRLIEHREDSTASDPGDAKERPVKKKQQTRQANDLDLAQKIILKRKVEEYIDRQEPEASMEDVEETNETTTTTVQESAWSEESKVHQTSESSSDYNEISEKKADRKSVQTVVSHKSDSSAEEIDRTSVHETVQEKKSTVVENSQNENISENNSIERSENSPSSSRPSTAGSDLNPHPVIPPIGTPLIPEDKDETVVEDNNVIQKERSNSDTSNNKSDDNESDPTENQSDSEDDKAEIPVAAVVAAGAVAAGTGVAAAVAIKARKSEKTKETTDKKQGKKIRKQEIIKEANGDRPNVAESVASAAAVVVPEKPKKPSKPSSAEKSKPDTNESAQPKPNEKKSSKQSKNKKEANKPLSLKTMSSNDMKSTIDALEQMVDNNIQDVIDNTKGKKTKAKDPEGDRRMVKAVMDPEFQAEINDFLAKT